MDCLEELMKRLNEFIDDLRKQGKAKNRPDSDFDPIELEIGVAVEHEHVDDEEAAAEIAKDHLVEDPHYYTRVLAKAEDEVMVKAKRILKDHGFEAIEDWYDTISR